MGNGDNFLPPKSITGFWRETKNTVLAGQGTPEPQKTYKVAFVDFTAHSSYELSKKQVKGTEQDFREAVIRYLKQ